MAKLTVNTGTSENSRDGDSLRAAFTKINANFTELYDRAVNTDAQTLTLTGNTLAITGGNSVELNISPTGDLKGSVFADDSTLLVDAVNASIPYAVLSGAPTIPVVPTALSSFTNDTGFITAADIPTDFKGSVFADDSTLLVDAVNANIPYSVLSGAPTIPADVSDLTDTGNLLSAGAADSLTSNNDINITINNDDSSTYVWNFGNTGDLTAPGDITTGLINTGGRFIQDCADGITSIRWVNVDPGDPVQIIRVYSDDPKINSDTAFERAQIGINWSASQVQSGLTITSFDSTDPDSANQIEHTWQFQGDGGLTFPDATVQTTAYPGPQTSLDGDLKGSVFADDSTLLVDGVNGVVPGTLTGMWNSPGNSFLVIGEGIQLSTTSTTFGVTNGGLSFVNSVDNDSVSLAMTGGNINLLASAGIGLTTATGFSLSTGISSLMLGPSALNYSIFNPNNSNDAVSLVVGSGGINAGGEGSLSLSFAGTSTISTGTVNWAVNGEFVLASNNIVISQNGVTADLRGSVFGDDSTVLVDGVDGKIVGPVDTASVTSTGNIAVTGQNTKFVTEFGNLGFNNDLFTWGLEATSGFGAVDLTSATIDDESGNVTARYTASLTNDGRFTLPVSATANISQLSSAPNNANASLRLTGGNAVEIVTGSQDINHTWTFDVHGDLTIPGKLILDSGGVHETFQSKTDATGVVTHDCVLGHIFYHTSADANWTANFTNINLASSTSTNLVLVIEQGATPYYPSAVQIGGAAQTIKWLGNVTPTPAANKTEIATFTIFNNAGTFTVLGSYSTYG